MKNVTISLPLEVAKFAKVYAAKEYKSLSRLVADLLSNLMTDTALYQEAKADFFSRGSYKIHSTDKIPNREDRYDRKILR